MSCHIMLASESRIEPEIRHRPILEDPGVQIESFWGYQLQSALSRLFRNRLHWNFVWKRVGHASVPWKLQKRLQGCSDTSKKLKVHPPRAQSERFEQSVPLFTIERSKKCGECQLRCNVILAPNLRTVFMHSSCSQEPKKRSLRLLLFKLRASKPFLFVEARESSWCSLCVFLFPKSYSMTLWHECNLFMSYHAGRARAWGFLSSSSFSCR